MFQTFLQSRASRFPLGLVIQRGFVLEIVRLDFMAAIGLNHLAKRVPQPHPILFDRNHHAPGIGHHLRGKEFVLTVDVLRGVDSPRALRRTLFGRKRSRHSFRIRGRDRLQG